MNRRGFLALLAGAVLDPERLLWVPGKKLISIPPVVVPKNPLLNMEFLSREALFVLREQMFFTRYMKRQNSLGFYVKTRPPWILSSRLGVAP